MRIGAWIGSAIAAFAFSPACFAREATSPTTIVIAGTISDVVEKVLPLWQSRTVTAVSFRRKADPTIEVALFELINSRVSANPIYRNNCVSEGWERVIGCDLRMIDDLISDFSLLEIFGSKDRQVSATHYRKQILLWVLSHELGHVELGHGRSDFEDDITGQKVFDAASHKQELDADERAVQIVGQIENAPNAYSVILDIANSLIRKSVCPTTYPAVCKNMPMGVGLIFDYTPDAKPIQVRLAGRHPEFVARFLRILFLAGMTSDGGHPLAMEASKAINLLHVETRPNEWYSLRRSLTRP